MASTEPEHEWCSLCNELPHPVLRGNRSGGVIVFQERSYIRSLPTVEQWNGLPRKTVIVGTSAGHVELNTRAVKRQVRRYKSGEHTV